jgi:hypothetical protein
MSMLLHAKQTDTEGLRTTLLLPHIRFTLTTSPWKRSRFLYARNLLKNVVFWDVRDVALVRTDVWEERTVSIITVTSSN